jgi:FAD:protein FMN transferase
MPADTFAALGTYVFIATRDPGELGRARRLTSQVLAEVDRTCSRFRPGSDLSRANARAGRWVEADPLLVAAVTVAVDAARLTGGLVHPLLGRNLVALGYDRDLGLLEDTGPVLPAASPRLDDWRAIGLEDDAVRVPAGTALDLGATGKAFAADLVAAMLDGELLGAALVSVGGDLAISREDGHPWEIAVSERLGGPAARVWLERGGLATSSTRARRWRRGGTTYHHVVDPRTGSPVTEVWTTTSCLGTNASAANTASTAAIVLGHDAPSWLTDRGVSARLVAGDGSVVRTGQWPEDEEWAA